MEAVPTEFSVHRTKIVDYLLNPDHAEGGPKAQFFLSCGFSRDDPPEFIRELFWHATAASFVRAVDGLWGTKFVFEGMLVTPNARNPRIRSVWHRAPGARLAELVTAYPI